MVVTDNGANVMKAVRLVGKTNDEDSDLSDDDMESDAEVDEEDEAAENYGNVDGADTITLHRFPCIAHTLQVLF